MGKRIWQIIACKNGNPPSNLVYYREDLALAQKKNFSELGYKVTLEQYVLEKIV